MKRFGLILLAVMLAASTAWAAESQSPSIAGPVTLGIGGVLAVTAIALGADYAVKHKKEQFEAMPVVTPEGAHLTLAYRW